jgi:pimeloyl-ACP methyl ester carboxylesterase
MSLYSRPTLGRMLSAVSPPLAAGVARRYLAGICGRPAVGATPDEMFEVVAATLRISEPTTRSLMPELFSGREPYPHHALTEDELARVTAPTTFVWGSEDRFQDPDDGRRAAAAMPDGSVSEVPGGHHPWWDDAEGCAVLIEEVVFSSRHGTDRLPARPDRGHPGG